MKKEESLFGKQIKYLLSNWPTFFTGKKIIKT